MLKSLFGGLIDILYPKVCLTCRKKLSSANVDNFVCLECWNNIKRNVPPFCSCCGRGLDKTGVQESTCSLCRKKKLYFDRAFSPCVYTGIIKELIHEFKYKNKDYLGLTLSRPMIEFIKEYNLPINEIDFIIPVPLHKARLREREFNQAEVLSLHIAGEFKKEVLAGILIRNRYTKTQTDLEINERTANVKDSFSVGDSQLIKRRNLLLIDDVLTTGATTSEAALTLKNSGANKVFVLTLAN
jgi:competence protein ComFC